MDAYFYNFNKRKNSTKVPTSTGDKKEVRLKDGTDFDNPVFIMQSNVTGYNYASWNGAYYFIVGRKYIANSIFEITMEIDPLATYASEIKASTQFVLRSSVSPDYTLIDTFYPTFYKPQVIQTKGTGLSFSDTGSYVLIVKTATGIKYYGITETTLSNIFNALMAEKQENLWADITDLAITILPGMLNVTDYIIGCKWIPFAVMAGQGFENIKLGYWDSGYSGSLYDKTLKTATVSQGFGTHLFTGTKEFMNNSQFYQITIFVPGCGEVPVDVAKMNNKNGLTVDFKIDVLGTVAGAIKNADGQYIQRFSGSLGRDVPISSSEGVASGLATFGGGVAALVTAGVAGMTGGLGGLALAGAIAGGVGAMGSGAANIIPDVNTKGALGSYMVPPGHDSFYQTEIIYDITTQNGNINGFPCMKTLTLSSNGYYQCKDPQVDFGDDLFQKDRIISYMTEGFYVE